MSLEFIGPSEASVANLAAFFARLEATGATRYFTPHPMNADAAKGLVDHPSDDYYLLAVSEGVVQGYGFLRWAKGYVRPSLGIAILPEHQGKGLAFALMAALHAEAARRGCAEVRLRVHPDNGRAMALYEKCGYSWQAEMDRGERVGIKALGRPTPA